MPHSERSRSEESIERNHVSSADSRGENHNVIREQRGSQVRHQEQLRQLEQGLNDIERLLAIPNTDRDALRTWLEQNPPPERQRRPRAEQARTQEQRQEADHLTRLERGLDEIERLLDRPRGRTGERSEREGRQSRSRAEQARTQEQQFITQFERGLDEIERLLNIPGGRLGQRSEREEQSPPSERQSGSRAERVRTQGQQIIEEFGQELDDIQGILGMPRDIETNRELMRPDRSPGRRGESPPPTVDDRAQWWQMFMEQVARRQERSGSQGNRDSSTSPRSSEQSGPQRREEEG